MNTILRIFALCLALVSGSAVYAKSATVSVQKAQAVLASRAVVYVDGEKAMPANAEVAEFFESLQKNVEWKCDVSFYEANVPSGRNSVNQNIVYKVSNCISN